MEWNRTRAIRRRAHDNRVYVEFDPDYSMPTPVVLRLFKWTRYELSKRVKNDNFPKPKHFAQHDVRYNPNLINDWLQERGGKI